MKRTTCLLLLLVSAAPAALADDTLAEELVIPAGELAARSRNVSPQFQVGWKRRVYSLSRF